MNFVRPSKNLIIALLPLIFIALGCSRLAALKANLFEGDNAEKAVAAIKDKIGKPFKVTEIVIERDELKVHAQDPNNPQNLDEYKYIGGFVTGPNAVKLNALNDNLEKSSFPIDQIDFAAVPQMIEDALRQAAVEGGEVTKMTFQRGFAIVENDAGSLGNARWQIEINGTRENVTATASPNGKVIGVDLSRTSRAASYKTTTREELQKAQNAYTEAFGANCKVKKVVIYEKYVFVSVVNPKNEKTTDDYKFDLSGLGKSSFMSDTIFPPEKDKLFLLSSVNLADAADYIEKAKNRLDMRGASVSSVSIQRDTMSVLDKTLRTTLDVGLQSGSEKGYVFYDLSNGGAEMRVVKNGETVSETK